MADALAAKTCTPCKGGIPPLTPQQAEGLQHQVPGWELQNDAHRIERKFKFGNFSEALRFVTQVGELADAEGHHPDVSFGWGYATVGLQTKKIRGLHENDFNHGRQDRSARRSGDRIGDPRLRGVLAPKPSATVRRAD